MLESLFPSHSYTHATSEDETCTDLTVKKGKLRLAGGVDGAEILSMKWVSLPRLIHSSLATPTPPPYLKMKLQIFR